jgi:hypothetical protein
VPTTLLAVPSPADRKHAITQKLHQTQNITVKYTYLFGKNTQKTNNNNNNNNNNKNLTKSAQETF